MKEWVSGRTLLSSFLWPLASSPQHSIPVGMLILPPNEQLHFLTTSSPYFRLRFKHPISNRFGSRILETDFVSLRVVIRAASHYGRPRREAVGLERPNFVENPMEWAEKIVDKNYRN